MGADARSPADRLFRVRLFLAGAPGRLRSRSRAPSGTRAVPHRPAPVQRLHRSRPGPLGTDPHAPQRAQKGAGGRTPAENIAGRRFSHPGRRRDAARRAAVQGGRRRPVSHLDRQAGAAGCRPAAAAVRHHPRHRCQRDRRRPAVDPGPRRLAGGGSSQSHGPRPGRAPADRQVPAPGRRTGR